MTLEEIGEGEVWPDAGARRQIKEKAIRRLRHTSRARR